MDQNQHSHHQLDDSYKLRQNQPQQLSRQPSPNIHIQTKEHSHIQQVNPQYRQEQQRQQYHGVQYTAPPQQQYQYDYPHSYPPPPQHPPRPQLVAAQSQPVPPQSQPPPPPPQQQRFVPGPSSAPAFQSFNINQPTLPNIEQQHQHQQQISPIETSITSPLDRSKTSPSPQKRKKYKKHDYTSPADQGETELKQLAMNAADIPLAELALKIRQVENEGSTIITPGSSDHFKAKENKERQRQLFGMVWLLNSCEHSPTAVVPRNRIYARYVQVCADNSLSPLSPASFGKLVRILFPTLTTRRLGMRGQSKYHYCGIKLNGDQTFQSHLLTQQASSSSQQQQLMSGFSGQQVDSPISSSNSSLSYDSSPSSSSQIHTPSYTPINSPSIAMTPTVTDQLPSVSHMKYVPNLFKLLNSNAAPSSNPYTPIQLPSIYPYLPRDTDYDIADTLHSLYKLHVNSIFEALRFMQLKKLFASFSNFNSKLTAPAFKLYTNECIIDWVKQCDLLMYKKMIRMLNKLQLQFLIPTEQLRQLKQISNGYIKTLSGTLMNGKISRNFVIMKLKLAKHFVNLLNRLIKVIETGQPASRILTDASEKHSMVQDWNKLDIRELISREIPCGDQNIETLTYILKQEVVDLLVDKGESGPTMFDFAEYISGLPGRFPQINARLFLLLSSNLLTACLRDISLAGGEGFGAWWIVRCWTDEYLLLTVELGGFFSDDFQAMEAINLPVPVPSFASERIDAGPVGVNSQGSPTESQQIETQHNQRSFPGDGSSINEASNPVSGAGNTSGFDNSLGVIDLLDTSLEFETRNSQLASMPSQSEILVNYESNIESILNQ
ncbi:uncharacterized protein SPAPADRAFT_70246 [Spathaspora passalidarum NRRL Y-27907]|uniref:RFX-type winged-helix domain-containing protein n=1 Tax=Spathaspora passalidarum (strain NRRL Y-27907 / 11-Y1) TaxID=619300 RepID=G3AK07_SPAPN|nr:uncharacterized protein SPAPADRAFT_70246 [Spathaspora passalidarum NRRL Y-27907]EGW34058.1 hypothetical protein SPAPADRAFT_70246 [Spathaspora passalidarum NRRL Y-27907]